MAEPIEKSDSKNIQIADLVKAMAVSEPCLFNNSSANLMPVIVKEPSIRRTDWINCELNPEYVKTVAKRIRDTKPQPKLPIN